MKKIKWVRVSINDIYPLKMKELMEWVDGITRHLGCRYFFLFEDDPEFMLQLDCTKIKKVKDYCKKHPFEKWGVHYIDNPEEKNPFALDFYYLGSKFAVFKALSSVYKDEYQFPNFVKLVHCLCNQQFASSRRERAFYFQCLAERQ